MQMQRLHYYWWCCCCCCYHWRNDTLRCRLPSYCSLLSMTRFERIHVLVPAERKRSFFLLVCENQTKWSSWTCTRTLVYFTLFRNADGSDEEAGNEPSQGQSGTRISKCKTVLDHVASFADGRSRERCPDDDMSRYAHITWSHGYRTLTSCGGKHWGHSVQPFRDDNSPLYLGPWQISKGWRNRKRRSKFSIVLRERKRERCWRNLLYQWDLIAMTERKLFMLPVFESKKLLGWCSILDSIGLCSVREYYN